MTLSGKQWLQRLPMGHSSTPYLHSVARARAGENGYWERRAREDVFWAANTSNLACLALLVKPPCQGET